MQVPLFTWHDTLHAANTSSTHGLHVALTPCFQLFRRVGPNVANLSQIAQRGCSVRSHGVVLHHLGMKGMGNAGIVFRRDILFRRSTCTSFPRRLRVVFLAPTTARPCAAVRYQQHLFLPRFRCFVRPGHASPLSHAAPSVCLTQSASNPRAATRPGCCRIPPKTQNEGRDP